MQSKLFLLRLLHIKSSTGKTQDGFYCEEATGNTVCLSLLLAFTAIVYQKCKTDSFSEFLFCQQLIFHFYKAATE